MYPNVPFKIGVVPEFVPRMSRAAEGVVVPMPTLPVPLGLRRILPVVLYVAELPRVKSFLLVVEILPFPSIKVATLAKVPEIEAVGVPEPTPVKANLADVVADPPISKSTDGFLGERTPEA